MQRYLCNWMQARSMSRKVDARSLIALAHPLRIRIRDHLRRVGPATATQLAKQFGESSGATSYHLRMLARHGFVEPLPDLGSGRERWWGVVPQVLEIGRTEFLDDASTRDALRIVTSEQHRLTDERLRRWLDEASSWSPDWRDSATDSVYVARLTSDQMAALARELNRLILRYVALSPVPDSRVVEIQLNVFPTGDPE
jgi:DNA-binding transcriptional ArsR family regulator